MASGKREVWRLRLDPAPDLMASGIHLKAFALAPQVWGFRLSVRLKSLKFVWEHSYRTVNG